MYGANCVAKRTRLKRQKYEESLERSRKNEKNKKKRGAKNSETTDAIYLSSDDEDFDILCLSESEDSGKAEACHKHESRKFSTGRGETSKYNAEKKVQGEVQGSSKRASHRYIDGHVISSEGFDGFDGKSMKDAESVASVAVPSAKEVEEVKKHSKENPRSRVVSRDTKGKNRSDYNKLIDAHVRELGKESDSGGIIFLDEVKDIRDVEKAFRYMCRTSISKVGNKCNETCHAAEIISKLLEDSSMGAHLPSSDDDGDFSAKRSEDEESVPSNSDTDSEEQYETNEDSSSSYVDLEDKDYNLSDHKYSERVDSDASSDDEDNQSSSSNTNISSPSMGETGRKPMEKQQSSVLVESASSTSSDEDNLTNDVKENVGKENEETIQLPKASRWRHGTKEDATFNYLANSILHQGDMHEKMEFEQTVENPLASASRLPLKFSFGDEIPEPPGKSYLDKEVEGLFSEMFFSLECQDMDSDSQAKTDFDYAEVVGTNQNECDHEYVIDEQIGLMCRICHHVKTEIRDILPPFAARTRKFGREGSSRKAECAASLGFESKLASDCNRNCSFKTDGTVWDTVHGVRHKLYEHQKEGFEFLWRNIGGSVDLSQLSSDSSKVGGCIISHAPGTGKTLLASVFVTSYLKKFPGSHPVIIAPANMLNTWEEEFKKWKVEYPFHNLNRDEPSGKEDEIALEMICRSNKPNTDVVRMAKLYSWDRTDSILGVSYTLLVQLAGKKTQNRKTDIRVAANRKLKGKNNTWRDILLKKPGLVILDEGHTPRNEKSNIWNTLVKLRTRKIIILSGTPFQNNFGELMNLLTLIRPEVVESLSKEKTFSELMPSLKYSRHQIRGRYADLSKDEARGNAIHELKAAIDPFVHVHKGSILKQTLPGLREYAMILNPHELQKSLLKKFEKSPNAFGVEHEVALISVHPRLLELYYLRKEQKPGLNQSKLEYSSLLPNEGVKTRFVLELVRLSLTLDEKVLIFSQFREPLYLIRNLLEKKFSWRDGHQIFLVEGGIPQNKRQNIIHSFNDPKSEVKVLLASTKCCSEGISLVGASRVVLLDVVWNPSVALQAISRAFRIGQEKMVYAYNLMISGTSEADKYRRQAQKERFSELVFTSTNKEAEEQQKPGISASDDMILGSMVEHASMKDIFDVVIGQPKESSFFKVFGSPL